MTLRRSASALHSLNIFYQVDVVVFCEGGKSLSYDEAINSFGTDGTLDSLYWEAVINSYNIPKKFHIKSIGSKTTLTKIAEDIRDRGVATVSICLDSDYDRIRGVNFCGPRVAWTMGYSWENDVVSFPVLKSILTMLVGCGDASAAACDDLRTHLSQLAADLQRWTEIDISLCARGKPAIFDRDKPLASIELTNPPAARHLRLSQRLTAAGYQRRPRKVVAVALNEVTIVCFGKLISRAVYHCVAALLRDVVNVRLDYELFMRLAISETVRAAAAGSLPDHVTHMSSQRLAFA